MLSNDIIDDVVVVQRQLLKTRMTLLGASTERN